jgi:hypothetical protein
MKTTERTSAQQATAGNERFGASGGVARPKVCAELEVLRPSERQWKPRLRQAAATLIKTIQTIKKYISK